MATETAPKRFYLSSLAPGAGKSQSVCAFVRTLLTSEYAEVGVIVCLARLSEIEPLAKWMKLRKDQFAVFTSDAASNALGSLPVDAAPVLFTTQQMLDRRCKGGSFEKVSEFNYQGRPRKVRVWDEAMMPGVGVSVTYHDITKAAGALRFTHRGISRALSDLSVTLYQQKTGGTVVVPDFARDQEVDIQEALGLAQDADTHLTLSDLWVLAGRTCSVRRDDGNCGNAVLDYHETLPADLAPVVILDASGVVRSAYGQWENSRGTLLRLRHCHKDYRNLTVHAWRRGGGKGSMERAGEVIAQGVASTILTKPMERWLVVHRKAKGGARGYDTVRDVEALLPDDVKANVSFLPWGRHQATNEFVEVKNVILAGTLFLRDSQYEALGRLASGTPSGAPYSDAMYQEIRLGEHADRILQALCRGAVRRLLGNTCGECDAYIIADSRSRIIEHLSVIFPGAVIEKWDPVPGDRSENHEIALDLIKKRLADGDVEVPFRDIMRELKVKDPNQFRRDVRNRATFLKACDAEGIIEYRKGKVPRGFTRKQDHKEAFEGL